MALRYDEHPLLFVTSTGSSVPNGRNVRTSTRTKHAVAHDRNAHEPAGTFAVIDFHQKRVCQHDDAPPSRKQRRRSGPEYDQHSGPLKSDAYVPKADDLINVFRQSPLPAPLIRPRVWPTLSNPSNTLMVANFHIRRIAAIVLLQQPERLLEVLRFRQWSYVTVTWGQPSMDPCLNCALMCLAAKLSRMTGGGRSSYSVLSIHTEALCLLQTALHEPRWHSLQDLLATTQILAIFEMLDSLDNAVWIQHVAGAKSLLGFASVESTIESNEVLSFGAIAPMLVDALLNANVHFLRLYDWQAMLSNASRGCNDDMIVHLAEVPQLLIDAEVVDRPNRMPSLRHDLLDKAHVVRSRLQTALLRSGLYSLRADNMSPSFDKLSLCSAGLVALDQLIASLRPASASGDHIDENKTSALCAQLIQLELKTADGDPAKDLISAFEL